MDTHHFDCIKAQGLLEMLSRVEQERSERMMERRRVEYLLTRVLLRFVFSERLVNVGMPEIVVTDREGLPPEVDAGPQTKIHFSVSHSHQRICIAVSEESPVGVDIEYLGGERQFTDVAQQYFSVAENIFLSEAKTQNEMRRRYYMIWTRKEAWLKLHLMGIGSAPLDAIEFQDGVSEGAESVINILFDQDYCLSVGATKFSELRLKTVDCEMQKGMSISTNAVVETSQYSSRIPDNVLK